MTDKQKLIEQMDTYVNQHRSSILEDLKRLVRIPSVGAEGSEEEPFGAECARALDAALNMAEEKGFCVKNHKNWYGTAYYCGGKREEDQALSGIFSHLDVVEAGEGWIYPPFEPVEKEDFIIGRGAGDNKSGAVIGLYAMQAIRDLNIPLESTLMVYFGCNEESGMKDIERFVREHPMPDYSMVPDLFFPVCYGEKGSLKLTLQARMGFERITEFSAGKADNLIPARARAGLRYGEELWKEIRSGADSRTDIEAVREGEIIIVTALGSGGHSALPEGTVDAIWVLTDFLKDLEQLEENDRSICRGFSEMCGDYDGQALGIAQSDEPSGKLVCAAVKAQMDGSIPEILFAVRYPVTDYRERIETDLLKTIDQNRFAVKESTYNAPLYMEKEHPYIQRLMKVYRQVTGNEKEPFVIDGGTYARKLKNAVGYGGGNGAHAPFLPEGHGRVHQPDEARSISGILEAIKIYVLSVVEIDEMIREQREER